LCVYRLTIALMTSRIGFGSGSPLSLASSAAIRSWDKIRSATRRASLAIVRTACVFFVAFGIKLKVSSVRANAVRLVRGLTGERSRLALVGLSIELEIVFQARVEPFAPGQRHNLKLAFAQPRAEYAQALLRVIPIARLAGGHVVIDLADFASDFLLFGHH